MTTNPDLIKARQNADQMIAECNHIIDHLKEAIREDYPPTMDRTSVIACLVMHLHTTTEPSTLAVLCALLLIQDTHPVEVPHDDH